MLVVPASSPAFGLVVGHLNSSATDWESRVSSFLEEQTSLQPPLYEFWLLRL